MTSLQGKIKKWDTLYKINIKHTLYRHWLSQYGCGGVNFRDVTLACRWLTRNLCYLKKKKNIYIYIYIIIIFFWPFGTGQIFTDFKAIPTISRKISTPGNFNTCHYQNTHPCWNKPTPRSRLRGPLNHGRWPTTDGSTHTKDPSILWPEPDLSFATAESKFATAVPKITNNLTKFHYLVQALDKDTALRVKDLIVNLPQDACEPLKTRLLQSFKLT